MRQTMLMLLLCPLACLGLTRSDVDLLLAKAAAAQSNAYLEARDVIVALGTNALPLLFDAATDANAEWPTRLMARICYERVVRNDDIQRLLNHEWDSYPPYHPEPPKIVNILGPSVDMDPYVIPKCRDEGLWYCYLEVTWKDTGEAPQLKKRRDRRFTSVWPFWCGEAVKEQPEKYYVPLVLTEKLATAKFASRSDLDLFGNVFWLKRPNAVPVLLQQYEAYNKRNVIGPETYPGENAKIFAIEFAPILDFADERHVELLEAYIADHPALAELKPKLAAVRARPAPPPVPDPPFRLGTNLVTRPPTVP